MRYALLLLSIALLSFFPFHADGQCLSPVNPTVAVDVVNFVSDVQWFAPSGGCPILYYELRYSSNPFDPNVGQGILISPINGTSYQIFTTSIQFAYVRSICDCEPMDGGDGIADSDGGWVEATVIIIPPPIFPDPGVVCQDAPIEPVELAVNCGNSGESIIFNALFESETTVSCSGELEYVIWRRFTAPSGGDVEVTMGTYTWSGGPWDDFGFMIKDGCNGADVFCHPSMVTDEGVVVTGLIPGQTYRIGSWNNDYLYQVWNDEWGTYYNGTENYLDICFPEVLCNPASNLSVNQITDHAVQLNWNANTSSEWIIEYGIAGFTPGTGMTISGVETEPLTIDGLDSETDYEFYVTADCGTDGLSTTSGPSVFTTTASVWVIAGVPDGSGYCCQELNLQETFNAGAFCDSVYFTFMDEITGEGCQYTIHRTITAHDTCGNSVQDDFLFEVIDNEIPCGCDSGQSFPAGTSGGPAVIHGDWAILSFGPLDKVMKKTDGEWVLHDEVDYGFLSSTGLDMYGEVFINGNRVYRLSDGEWLHETTLISSAGDSASTTGAIHENEIVWAANGRMVIFEYDGNTWTEVALFNQSVASLDMSDDLIGIGIYGNDSLIGSVYRKIDGVWTFEQDLPVIADATGYSPGSSVAIDGTHFATGSWYLGGLHTYEFNGTSWGDSVYWDNPYLIPSIGYNTAFGMSIDIEGDLMVVGDDMNKTYGNFSGSVTVFEWTCEGWTPQRSIVPLDGVINMRFGGHVDLHEGELVVGIDGTYWLGGGGGYGGAGKYWFYSCLETEFGGCPIQAAAGGTLECGSPLPEVELTLSEIWNDEYIITIELIGEMSCNDTLIRNIYVEDIEGNTGTAQQVYYFVDTQAPYLECPTQMVVQAESDGLYLLPDYSTTLVATDLCDLNPSIFQSLDAGTPLETGVYEFELWAEDDCGNQFICDAELTVDPYVGLLETSSIQFELYPNPASNEITISYNEMEFSPTLIRIIDAQGRLVKEEKTAQNQVTISVADIESGMYEVVLLDRDLLRIGARVIVITH